MKNAWLYVLASEHYPKDTYCILFTDRTRKVIECDLEKTHFVSPRMILGYALADYPSVLEKIKKIVYSWKFY